MKKKIFRIADIVINVICVFVILNSAYSLITGEINLVTGFGIVNVSGESMYPTLNDKDKLVVVKGNEFKTGDIIVFDSNTGEGRKKYFIKRVIATQGQEIDIRDGKVYIDGEELNESYYDGVTLNHDMKLPMVIGENSLFVMGDNRNNSLDSRSSVLGVIDKSDIVGKAVYRVTPMNKFGSLA